MGQRTFEMLMIAAAILSLYKEPDLAYVLLEIVNNIKSGKIHHGFNLLYHLKWLKNSQKWMSSTYLDRARGKMQVKKWKLQKLKPTLENLKNFLKGRKMRKYCSSIDEIRALAFCNCRTIAPTLASII